MGPCIPVILAQAGIQGHTHQSRLPLWTPDHVRGDDVSHKRALTLRSVASRRGSPLEAPDLQPLLRDGAIAPPQDEGETSRPVIFAQAVIQGHKHQSCVPLWTPDQVRGDEGGDMCAPQDENGTLHPRHTRAGGYPGPHASIAPAALDPGSRPG
jgi:hypothetical protein